MVRTLSIVALFALSLSSLVGCGAAGKPAASPQAGEVVMDESMWSPEDEETVHMREPGTRRDVADSTTTAPSAIRPNLHDRPRSGAVHAATY